MTPKEIFIKDEVLCAFWNGVAKGPQFPMVLALARAELSRVETLNPDMLRGVALFEQILENIGQREDNTVRFPAAGMNHNLDNPRNETKEKKD